jgi:hypothetical protein
LKVNPIDVPRDERPFLFSVGIRRVLFYSGLFVLYSQLVSASLTGVYRYSPRELSLVDGGNPEVFDPWTFTLLQAPEGIGTINDLQAIGWRIEYSPIRYALWAIVPPILILTFGEATTVPGTYDHTSPQPFAEEPDTSRLAASASHRRGADYRRASAACLPGTI